MLLATNCGGGGGEPTTANLNEPTTPVRTTEAPAVTSTTTATALAMPTTTTAPTGKAKTTRAATPPPKLTRITRSLRDQTDGTPHSSRVYTEVATDGSRCLLTKQLGLDSAKRWGNPFERQVVAIPCRELEALWGHVKNEDLVHFIPQEHPKWSTKKYWGRPYPTRRRLAISSNGMRHVVSWLESWREPLQNEAKLKGVYAELRRLSKKYTTPLKMTGQLPL